jgi:hypothetical protein
MDSRDLVANIFMESHMVRSTKTHTDEVYTSGGLIISSVTRTVDITAEVTEIDLRDKARAAVTSNRDFLAISTPTNAQVLAQVRALTKQMNAVIRLKIAIDLLDDDTVD